MHTQKMLTLEGRSGREKKENIDKRENDEKSKQLKNERCSAWRVVKGSHLEYKYAILGLISKECEKSAGLGKQYGMKIAADTLGRPSRVVSSLKRTDTHTHTHIQIRTHARAHTHTHTQTNTTHTHKHTRKDDPMF